MRFPSVGSIYNINHKQKQAQLLLPCNQDICVSHFASISRQSAACHGRLGVQCHRDLAFKSAQPDAFCSLIKDTIYREANI